MCRINECPLSGSVEVPYAGVTTADIVYFGESPSYDEIRHPPRPFIGKQWNKGREICAKAGVPWNSFFLMNSARCLINKKELPDKDIRIILKCCREHVVKALNHIKPKAIILAGDFALRQVLGRKGITKARHEIWIWSEEFNCWCKPTYHPSYVFRNPPLEKDAVKDFRDVKQFVDNGFKPVDHTVVTDYKEVQSIHPYIDDAKSVGFDTEDQGLAWHNPDHIMLGYSISKSKGTGLWVRLYEETDKKHADLTIKWNRVVGKKSTLVDVYVKESSNFKNKCKELWYLLQSPDIKKVMMNGNFDIHCCRTLFRRVYKKVPKIEAYTIDVQVGAQLLDENLYNFASLEILQHAFTDRRDNYNSDFDKKYNKADMLSVPNGEFPFYAGGDADVTRQVAVSIANEICKYPRIKNYLQKFVMPTLGSLRRIEEAGVPIDAEELPVVRDELTKIKMKAQLEAVKLIPPKIRLLHRADNLKKKDGIYLTRDAFIRDTLFHEDGFKLNPIRLTKTKQPSVDKHTVKELLEKTKNKRVTAFLNNVQVFRKHSHIISNSLTGFEKHLTPKGYVHSKLSIAIARTGRVSAREPNNMNFPKRDPIAVHFRKLIKPPKGWFIFTIDESQSELRWMAQVSKDPEMIRIYNTAGADIHTETGKDLSGMAKSWEAMSEAEQKKARQNGKAGNFGLIFGMSAYGFMMYAKSEYGVPLTKRQAQQWVDIFFGKYRGIRPYHRRTIEFCKQNGCVESPLGRRRRLPDINSDVEGLRRHAENEAVNHPVQSPSSDTVLIACNQLLGRSPLNPELMKNTTTKELLHRINFNDTRDYGLLNPDECKPFMFVHDELVFMVKDNSRAMDYMKLIKFEMENPPLERDFGVKLRVPLVAEGKISHISLADMEDIEL